MVIGEGIYRFFADLTFPRACYILVVTTLVSCAVGIAAGNRYVTPVLNVAAFAPFYLWAAAAGRYGRAVGLGLLWLACTAVFFTVGTALCPVRAGAAVLYGEGFNADFNAWLFDETAALWLGDTWGYAGASALDGCFAFGLSLFTGGLGGLAVAAVKVGYLSYNAGRLLLSSTDGTLSMLFAWPFWELLKVIGLVNLTVSIGVPAVRFMLRREVKYKIALEHFVAGVLFLGMSVFVHRLAVLFWRDVLAEITIIG